MSRIPAVEAADAEGKTKELLDRVQKTVGMIPNLHRVAAQSPAALDGLISLMQALDRGRLKPQLRQQIGIVVAECGGSDYCLSAHTTFGKMMGVSDDDLALARDAQASDARVATALRFARDVVDRCGQISDDDLAMVLQAGFSQGDVVEIVAQIALTLFASMINNVAETDVEFPRVSVRQAA